MSETTVETPTVDAWVVGEHAVPTRLRPVARTAEPGSVVVRENGTVSVLSPEAFAADFEWV